jgi:hypothetical protein
MKKILSLLFLLSAFGLSAQFYSYSDGNSNVYNITSDKIEYIPVKKENSSSGTYSGGKAKVVKIKLKDFESLKTLFEEGIRNINYDLKRELGTGQIYKADKAGTKVILAKDSELKARIEKQLVLIMK